MKTVRYQQTPLYGWPERSVPEPGAVDLDLTQGVVVVDVQLGEIPYEGYKATAHAEIGPQTKVRGRRRYVLYTPLSSRGKARMSVILEFMGGGQK